jgi:hypothetical protein
VSPRELLSGPKAMAIRAPHLALVDFRQDAIPWFPHRDPRDGHELRRRIDVIEVEDG